MTQAPGHGITDVELLTDTFAREHDIDAYYTRSSFIIRWIERCRLNIIRNFVAAAPGGRLLEVGCGGGHVLQMFRELDLTGVDVSGEMIRKAHRNLKGYRVELLKGELETLGLPAGAYDKIICTEVLEHVVDPTSILEHIHRLLKPNGRVVITFPNDHLINGLKRTLHRSGLTRLPPFQGMSWGGDHYHLHVWRIREMRALLSRYFSIESARFAPNRFLPIRCCFLCSHQ